jgi:hypothetical protein
MTKGVAYPRGVRDEVARGYAYPSTMMFAASGGVRVPLDDGVVAA